MRVTILNQWMGNNPVIEHVVRLLEEGVHRFGSAKFLVAFTNRRGLRGATRALKEYQDSGGQVEFIVGIDLEVTDLEALHYLVREFPEAEKHVFCVNNPGIVFHPKVYLFEGASEVAAIMGSSNLTAGGLLRNFEAGVCLELDKAAPDDQEIILQLEDLWETYRNPQAPLQPENLQSVEEYLASIESDERLVEIRNRIETERSHRFETRRGLLADEFPRINLTIGWPDSRGILGGVEVGGNKLYLQILRETGTAGTQIQIPIRVLREFFEIHSFDQSASIVLQFEGAEEREVNITHFDNYTHRISLAEVGTVERPAMLILERSTEEQRYRCSIIEGDTEVYEEALEKCTEQTRVGAKRWGIVN